ncbi:MAG: hypothetical protein R2826_03525 [Thermoleophilia bacterium]
MADGRVSPASTRSAATERRRWNQRSFAAAGALLSGLALPLSGLADHVAGGSGGSSAGWSIVHTSLGGIFVCFCIWHAVLNRRALLRHLRIGAAARGLLSREALAALALVGGVSVLTVTHALLGP